MDSRTARAVPVLLALGCTWGASFLFIKVIVDDTGPMEVVFGRLFLGMAAIGGYILATRHKFAPTWKLAAQTVGHGCVLERDPVRPDRARPEAHLKRKRLDLERYGSDLHSGDRRCCSR